MLFDLLPCHGPTAMKTDRTAQRVRMTALKCAPKAGLTAPSEVAKYVSLQTSQTTLQLSGKHFVACSESPCVWTKKKYLYASGCQQDGGMVGCACK